MLIFTIVASAVLTAIAVNFVISVVRRHQEHSRVNINFDAVLDDARDVSLSVQRLQRQLGGRPCRIQ